jgi:hypothetical protein
MAVKRTAEHDSLGNAQHLVAENATAERAAVDQEHWYVALATCSTARQPCNVTTVCCRVEMLMRGILSLAPPTCARNDPEAGLITLSIGAQFEARLKFGASGADFG